MGNQESGLEADEADGDQKRDDQDIFIGRIEFANVFAGKPIGKIKQHEDQRKVPMP
jgi:hypothetical protein